MSHTFWATKNWLKTYWKERKRLEEETLKEELKDDKLAQIVDMLDTITQAEEIKAKGYVKK